MLKTTFSIGIPVLLLLCLLWKEGSGKILVQENTLKEDEHGYAKEKEKERNLSEEFKSLLKETGSLGNWSLSLSALRNVINRLGLDRCLQGDALFEVLRVNKSQGLNEKDFTDASVILAFYLQRNQTSPCTNSGKVLSPLAAKQSLFQEKQVCRENFSDLLEKIVKRKNYTGDISEKCFGAADILAGCTNVSSAIDKATMKMVVAMVHGWCVLPDFNFFQKELLDEFDSTNKGFLTQKEFEELLDKFNLGDHDDQENEKHRRKRSVDTMKRCYSTSELMYIAGKETNANGTLILSSKGLNTVCPAIMQQFVTKACEEDSPHEVEGATTEYTGAQKYGFATAAVFIISLLAFGGLLLFPSIGSESYKMSMQFFIALGVGTLSGDALLHLIPEVVGLHGHEKEAVDGHGHKEAENGDKLYIYRLTVVIAGIYVFFLFENVLRLYNQIKGSNITFHYHDDEEDHEHDHMQEEKQTGQHHTISRNSISAITKHAPRDEEKTSKDSLSDSEEDSSKKQVCCGVTPVGIMVLIGDCLHNFGDGLALGVAFSSSWVGGVGASIAIFCHELPHEFGDFAIYLKNGMSKWLALGLNFVAACCAFIGLYIGLSVSENPAARQWMLAVIAGMFLYISLVDVLHEMIEDTSKDHPFLQFFLQNFGMCLGWAILVCLALYEKRLEAVFN